VTSGRTRHELAGANEQAARIGPTVCELDGPIPTVKQVEDADGHVHASFGATAISPAHCH
jgi:hypothetical protein